MERMGELPLSKLWKEAKWVCEERRIKGLSATRPKCVLNRLICHALSSREIKSTKSLCVHTVVSTGTRDSDCSRLCVRQSVMSVHVYLITTMIAHLGISFCLEDKRCRSQCNSELVHARALIQEDMCCGIQSI